MSPCTVSIAHISTSLVTSCHQLGAGMSGSPEPALCPLLAALSWPRQEPSWDQSGSQARRLPALFLSRRHYWHTHHGVVGGRNLSTSRCACEVRWPLSPKGSPRSSRGSLLPSLLPRRWEQEAGKIWRGLSGAGTDGKCQIFSPICLLPGIGAGAG